MYKKNDKWKNYSLNSSSMLSKIWQDSTLYYWTYRSFPWSAFLKISFSTLISILKDHTLALTIESPCLKYEIANRGCNSLIGPKITVVRI